MKNRRLTLTDRGKSGLLKPLGPRILKHRGQKIRMNRDPTRNVVSAAKTIHNATNLILETQSERESLDLASGSDGFIYEFSFNRSANVSIPLGRKCRNSSVVQRRWSWLPAEPSQAYSSSRCGGGEKDAFDTCKSGAPSLASRSICQAMSSRQARNPCMSCRPQGHR